MSNPITDRRIIVTDCLTPSPAMGSNELSTPRTKTNGGMVFVAKKLSALLSAQRARKSLNPEGGDSLSVEDLMQHCWVPAIEAVRDWGMMPEGVTIAPCPWAEGFILLQADFDCAYPGVYSTVCEAHEAAATLIQGKPIIGSGTLAYRGQAMTPLRPIDVEHLPRWPQLLNAVPHKEVARAPMTTPLYRQGFPLLERELFEAIMTESQEWESRMADLREGVIQNENLTRTFFEQHAQGSLDILIDVFTEGSNPDHIHGLYPELAHLDSPVLAGWLRHYCNEVAFDRMAETTRDVRFLAYLAGIITQAESRMHGAVDAGWGALFAWVIGHDADTAMALGRELEQYSGAISDLVYRTTKILARLERDALTLGDQGELIELHSVLRRCFESGSRHIH